MSLLIKMKPNFAVRNNIDYGDNYILVSNYASFNEVENLGFTNKQRKDDRRSRIGGWNIKYKNQNK